MKKQGKEGQPQYLVRFLIDLANNQRKLQYCRQILTSNPSFIPRQYFQNTAKTYKNQMTQPQFHSLLGQLQQPYSQAQKTVIFSYFQCDDKDSISYEEFYASIVPQSDPSLCKLMERREREEMVLDYQLKYSLLKFFNQVYESQCALMDAGSFVVESQKNQARRLNNRVSVKSVEEFLKLHAKYPEQKLNVLIAKELNLNKGVNKRNMLVREYIASYLNKANNGKGQIPKITATLQPQFKREPIITPTMTPKVEKKRAQSHNTKQMTPSRNFADVQDKIKNLLKAIAIKPSPQLAREQYQKPKSNKQNQERRPSSLKKSVYISEEEVEDGKALSNYNSIFDKQSNKNEENKKPYSARRSSSAERNQLRKRFNLDEQTEKARQTPQRASKIERFEPKERSKPKQTVGNRSPQRRVKYEYDPQDSRYQKYKRYSYLQNNEANSQRIKYLKGLLEFSPAQDLK